jgi:predicted ester cyclase
MNKSDLVKTMLKDLESGNAQKGAVYYAEDFVFSGPVPEPLNKDQFLDLMTAMTKGLPDWAFNVTSVQEKGSTVSVKVQITGTHKGILAVPGLPTVSPTGKRIKLPAETLEITVEGDKITDFRVDVPPGGGVPGIYQQLGIKLPELAPAFE